jgi:RNA polymerase sigma-70 factor, ECF subfamily
MNQDAPETERNRRFAAVCEPLRADLYRFAFWLSRDPQVADDVVQETLLRAWRSLDALKDDSSVRQWLLTIARREHARLFERKRHPTVDIDALVAGEEASLGASDERDRDLEEVRRAIFELDHDYREPLVLQVLLGYTTQEIAAHMNLNTGAVLTRLFRARNRLRKRLGLFDDEVESQA